MKTDYKAFKDDLKKFVNCEQKKVLVINNSTKKAMAVFKELLKELGFEFKSDYRSVVFDSKVFIKNNYSKAVVFNE